MEVTVFLQCFPRVEQLLSERFSVLLGGPFSNAQVFCFVLFLSVLVGVSRLKSQLQVWDT